MFKIKSLKQYFRKRTSAKYPGLEFAFTYSGHDYFQYGDRVELPINRMGEIMRFQQLISAGVTGDTLRTLTDAMNTEIAKLTTTDPKKKEFSESLSRLNRLNTEIMFRRDAAVPTELMYNYLAAVYIRDDENPTAFIWDIHLQKVETFKTISENDHAFFFANAHLRASISWLNITEENWPEFLSLSKVSEQWTKTILSHISSWNKSEPTNSGAKI
jgi:hypothetical protein